MAIDEVKIWVKAGDGGKGCRSLYRNKYMRYPKADGGCGGDGGDVVIESSEEVANLREFHFKQHFKAENGKHGQGNCRRGRDGEDLVIKVPVGTIVKDLETGKVLRDLDKPRMRVVVAKGGRGGIGNAYTKDHSVIPPTDGQERHLLLELKVLADVGIIGLPNSGKSTLLNRLTSAGSKIGDYPFTTKNPVLGTINREDISFVISDMPGLIEGAHKGRGLGYRFLRHIERARILLEVIDASSNCPWEDYFVLEKELREYNPLLLKKRRVLVLNKVDLLEDDENLRLFREKTGLDFISISALRGDGIDILVKNLCDLIRGEGM